MVNGVLGHGVDVMADGVTLGMQAGDVIDVMDSLVGPGVEAW